jgi:hypothetical protein
MVYAFDRRKRKNKQKHKHMRKVGEDKLTTHPEVIEKVAMARATGLTQAESAALVGVKICQVATIIRENPEAMLEAKSALARKMLSLSEQATEHASDVLAEASPKDAALIAGIMADKAMALTGTAPQTQINLQVIVNRMSELDRVERQITELEKQQAQVIDVEIEEDGQPPK